MGKELENFNRTIAIWMDAIPGYDLELLLRKPDPMSWSLGQVYEHVLEESHWFNLQLTASLEDRVNQHMQPTEEGITVLKRGSFADVKIVGDPVLAANVKQPQSIGQLISDFQLLKQETTDLHEQMLHSDTGGKAPHPGLGYLTCWEWLRFSEMHMRHHLKQKRRLEEILRYE